MTPTPHILTQGEHFPHTPGAEEAVALAGTLAQHPYFADFSLDDLAALVLRGEMVEAEAGTRLIQMGEPGTFALLVVEGTALVTIDTPYAAVELARLPAPCVIGEVAAFTGVTRTAHVDAATRLVAVRLGAEALAAAGHAQPGLLSAVMRQFGHRFETFNRAFGFYADALNALERQDFDLRLLDDLRNPLPEMVNFSHSFRRLAEAIMKRVAERREMANAAAIQRAMLPAPLSAEALGGRARIRAEMRPAKDVGGDFYDYFLLDDRRLVVSLGDVAGKGTPAALFMSATQTALRMVLRNEPDVARALKAVNDLLCATNSEDMFATVFCGVLDLDSGAFTYANCGHTDCMIVRADGRIERPAATGIALAILEGARLRAATTTLAPGDRLFLYSDGLPDAIDIREAAFGEERLLAAVEAMRALPADAFVPQLLDAILAYSGTAPQFDDMTVLTVDYSGPA